MTTITTAKNYPGDNGKLIVDSDQWPYVVDAGSGTSIAATLQFLTATGNWVNVPDSNAVITGDWGFGVLPRGQTKYRINVTAVTGTWDYGL